MDWGNVINGFASLFAAISAWAAYVTVREARKSEAAARSDREAEHERRKWAFLRNLVPVLHEVLADLRIVEELIDERSSPSASAVALSARDFVVPNALRLRELEKGLELLSGDDAARIAFAMEQIRQFGVLVGRAAREDPASNPLGLLLHHPRVLKASLVGARLAVEAAMEPYSPKLPTEAR